MKANMRNFLIFLIVFLVAMDLVLSKPKRRKHKRKSSNPFKRGKPAKQAEPHTPAKPHEANHAAKPNKPKPHNTHTPLE